MSTVSYNKISQNISRTEMNSLVEYILRLVLKNEQVITLNSKKQCVFVIQMPAFVTKRFIREKTCFYFLEDLFPLARKTRYRLDIPALLTKTKNPHYKRRKKNTKIRRQNVRKAPTCFGFWFIHCTVFSRFDCSHRTVLNYFLEVLLDPPKTALKNNQLSLLNPTAFLKFPE